MKLLKNLCLLSIFLFGSSSISASSLSDLSSNPTASDLRYEIKKMIKSSIDHFDNDGTLVMNFLVNTDNQLVIVSIDKGGLGSSVKSALNYEKVEARDFEANKLYTMRIKFEKE